MNNSFLYICAEDMYAKYSSDDFAKMTLVFPNKRAITFFKKHFSTLIQKPVFLPHFTTIKDLFSGMSSAFVPEQIVLIYILYDVYKKHTGSSEDFDSFYAWGEMLLRDFHDIDTYLISADLLFTNISSLKSYEHSFAFLSEEQIQHISRFWDVLAIESSSEAKQSFLDIWNVLLDIYTDFKAELRKKSYAYQGMVARDIIEECKKTGDFVSDKTFCFIGFNALNECEKELFSFLKNRSQARFYWDYDVLYTQSNYAHEAGYFIAQYLSDYPNEIPESYFNSFSKPKKICIRAVPQAITQTKVCSSWMSSQKDASHEIDAAVVLADEQLITPLLSSIPDEVTYNISLGYPIRSTQAYTLFVAVLDLYTHMKQSVWYYKDVFRICESPLIDSRHTHSLHKLKKKVVEKNAVYVSSRVLDGLDVGGYFETNQDVDSFLDFLERIVLYTSQSDNCNDIEQSVLYAIYKEIKQIVFLKQEYAIPISSIRFVANMLTKSLSSAMVPIEGEPLQGVQIMGVLETRALDFSSLMVVSVNEGAFPKNSVGSSFIPYSLRTGFGMPTIKEQTAIYSYYFYRLLQRAQDITILYSAQTDDFGKGEMSRYILQLMYNTELAHNAISHYIDSFSVLPLQKNEIIIPKTDEFFEFLDRYKEGEKHSLSPSAITTYLSCPLKFYFKYIRRIALPDELSELPDERQFGNVFHKAIEEIYKADVGTEISPEWVREIMSDTDFIMKQIDASIQEELKVSVSDDIGAISLIRSTIQTYIRNTLQFDLHRAPFFLVGAEEKVAHQLQHVTHPIYIGGTIDRLEKVYNQFVIIDYKTGSVKDSVSSIDNLFSRDSSKDNSAILQSLIYCYIIAKEHDADPTILLYFIRQIHSGSGAYIRIGKDEMHRFSQFYAEFEESFLAVIDELCDAEVPFFQTQDEKACQMCDFSKICKKNL